jgi:glycerol-3-phosphate dehydrogenase
VQEHAIPLNVAERLSRAYGGRASDIIEIARGDQELMSLLVPGYPYILAEVVYAVRYEWAVKIEDVIARRTSLAFLNKKAAISSIDKVGAIMAKESKWSTERLQQEIADAYDFMSTFGGPDPVQAK